MRSVLLEMATLKSCESDIQALNQSSNLSEQTESKSDGV